MTRYIIIPKNDRALERLEVEPSGMTEQSRVERADEVLSARKSDEVSGDVIDALEKSKDFSDLIASPTEDLPALGVAIIDAGDNDKAELQSIFKEMSVVEDKQVSLVEPTETGSEFVSSPTNLDLWHLEAIGLNQVRQSNPNITGAGALIAVLDTGISLVPELSTNIVGAVRYDDISKQIVENPGIGDTYGHGTFVTGLICGATTGIAPAAAIVDVLMLPGGNPGWHSNYLSAFNFIISQRNIPIVNISAGLDGWHEDMRHGFRSLYAHGVLAVAAIGNTGQGYSISPGSFRRSLSVGATTREFTVYQHGSGGWFKDELGAFSKPNLVAPGVNVTSCTMNGGYAKWEGTSMATAIVTGAAALVHSVAPQLNIEQTAYVILSNCFDLSDRPERQGSGLLSTYNIFNSNFTGV
ncbi:MAG: S8/S53 family peptidase [Pseudomonadota bacterium]